jgi:hypothetical protein
MPARSRRSQPAPSAAWRQAWNLTEASRLWLPPPQSQDASRGSHQGAAGHSPVGQLAFSSQASSVVTWAVAPIAQHSISSGDEEDG